MKRPKIPFPIRGGDYVEQGGKLVRVEPPVVAKATAPAPASTEPGATPAPPSKRKPGKSKSGNQE